VFYIVAYDITDSKRRVKLYKLLKGYGIKNQFSLFECHLDKNKYEKMLNGIKNIIDENKDNVKIYYLCNDCFKKIVAIGHSTITRDKNIIII